MRRLTCGIEGMVHGLHHFPAVELLQDRREGTPVPVVGHPATVVALAGQVEQRVVLDILEI